ncbi:MAG: ATP-dependent helicase [Campylobacterales bacterium]
MNSLKLLDRLNREQLAAATAPVEGYQLVIASAGTGKTSTIVARIGYLLKEGIPPEEILLLTFTNKAAQEMKGRLVREIPEATAVEAGTFHGVSYRWLRQLNPQIAIRPPKDMKLLLRSIYEKRQLFRLGEGERPISPAFLYDLYSLFQNQLAGDFGEWFLARYPEQEPFLEGYIDILEEFEGVKRLHNLIDFNTLLLEMVQYLKRGGKLRFKYLLVDEYQDTNPLQSHLIDLIEKRALFCVGDYDQSIYGFNGADISIIASFPDRYPGAQIYTLKKNYRSYGEILEVANRVIGLNPRLFRKKLEVTKGYSGVYPDWREFWDTYDQYRQVAEEVARARGRWEEIAILYRSNSSGDGIEAHLRQLGVPVRRKGGVSFFETREVKVGLDLLRFLINPADIMAFIHLIHYGPGIGEGLAQQLFEGLKQVGKGNPRRGLLSPLPGVDPFSKPRSNSQLGLFGEPPLPKIPVQKFRSVGVEGKFLEHPILRHPRLKPEGGLFLFQFREFLKSVPENPTPSHLLTQALHSPFFHQIFEKIAEERSRARDRRLDREKLIENREKVLKRWEILIELSKNFQSLDRFANTIALNSGEMAEGRGVNLMTIHASKGLEFQEVYLIDLNQGKFPHSRLGKGPGGVEEERRLFYVAVTRAKERLHFTSARWDPERRRELEPSQFLAEAGYPVSGVNRKGG